MPIELTIDHHARHIRLRPTGPVALADVLAAQDQQAASDAWAYSSIADYTTFGWNPTSSDIRAALAHIERISRTAGKRGPVAMVARSNTALFGMFRMYALLYDDRFARIEAFTTIDEARVWLTSLAPTDSPADGQNQTDNPRA